MSIAARLALAGFVVVAALAALSGAILWLFVATDRTDESQGRAGAALASTGIVLEDLTDAETGVRGFIITGAEAYLEPFNRASAKLDSDLARLISDASNDPQAAASAAAIAGRAVERLKVLSEAAEAEKKDGFEAGAAVIRGGRGKELMDAIRGKAADIRRREQALIDQSSEQIKLLSRDLVLVIAVGTPLVGLITILTKWLLWRSLRTSLATLEGSLQRIGGGDLDTVVATRGTPEFGRLARAFNDMIAKLSAEQSRRREAEGQLQHANSSLAARSSELERRSDAMDLLGRMANRLPGCADQEELAEVVARFAPQILKDAPGALFALSNSGTVLRSVTRWQDPQGSQMEFAPLDCWALRRGHPHVIADIAADVACQHIHPESILGYCCLPLIAQGETAGLLYIERRSSELNVTERDLDVLCETVALSLVNLRLRETLKSQSIRDPLTGLFNRRYLEEFLALEFERSKRSGQPVSIVMVDIDHFKRFNDTFGHDAGDVVLKLTGEMLRGSIRKGDVSCRYGGEEFMLVLPATSIEGAAVLAEKIRVAAHNIQAVHRGQSLGAITVSIGIATYPDDGDAPEEVIGNADQALYAAKRLGRDRVELSVRGASAA